MKQFAIAINSEKEYNKVKAYSEKWGYKRINNENVITKGWLMIYEDKTFNDNNFPLDKSVYIEVKDNWKKLIRKHSPLTIENTYLEIDTVEKVKAVWDVLKDGGKDVYEGSKRDLEKNISHGLFPSITYDGSKFVRTNVIKINNKTLITPKHLAQMLGVKSIKKMLKEVESKPYSGDYYDDPSVAVKGAEKPKMNLDKQYKKNTQKAFDNMIWDDLRNHIDDVDKEITSDLKFIKSGIDLTNERINKLAKNYKILDTDDLITRKEFKEYNSKLRKRIYDLESKFSEPVNLIVKGGKSLTMPKIAIRIENEQEFNDLMKIYEVLGWRWNMDNKPTSMKWSSIQSGIIKFADKVIFVWENDHDFDSYTIIPLSQIKGLK